MLLQCNKCDFSIDASDPSAIRHFYPKHRNKPLISRSSYSTTCADCMKKYKKDYYAQNSQDINKKHRDQRYANHERSLELEAARRLAKTKNPGAILYRRSVQALDPDARYIHNRIVSWKASARRRKLEWSITEEHIHDLMKKQEGKCFYLGQSLVLEPNNHLTVSLDRLDSEKGYVEGNVVLCGATVNRMKLDMGCEEFKTTMAALLDRAAIWCR